MIKRGIIADDTASDMKSILVVEDSEEIQMIVERSLSNFYRVTLVGSLSQARSYIQKLKFDLIILDLSLPDGDGLQFCSELKSSSQACEIPVIILSAKNSIKDKAEGFQLGIEDYITKPFDPSELKIRIESRLKKISEFKRHSDQIEVGNLMLDLSSRSISCINDNKNIDLSTKEFAILVYLARHIEQVKSRQDIINAVWGQGCHMTNRTIDSHICRIRKKIASDILNIEAITSSGYKLSISQRANKAA